jgi:hypothetical protein
VADLGFDGMISVWWVPTIADITAPKAATEIGGAGSVRLDPRLTPDGLDTGAGSDTIDTSKMASTFNTKIVGRRNFDGLKVMYVRGDAVGEQLLDTTLVYKAQGYLVVRRGVAASVAPAAAQKVEVYPAQCGEPQYASPAPNALQTVTVPLTLTADPRSSSNPATTVA